MNLQLEKVWPLSKHQLQMPPRSKSPACGTAGLTAADPPRCSPAASGLPGHREVGKGDRRLGAADNVSHCDAFWVMVLKRNMSLRSYPEEEMPAFKSCE